MKKRSLFIAYTPFQIIMAILIRSQYKDDVADICVVDSSSYTPNLEINLKRAQIFESVVLIEDAKSAGTRMKDLLFNLKARRYLKDNVYDSLFVCMSGYTSDFNNECFDLLKKRNLSLEVFGYVEGYSSYTDQYLDGYTTMSASHRMIYTMRDHILRKKRINELDKIYVFCKSLLNEKINDDTIDLSNADEICDESLAKTIKSIFGYSSEKFLIPEHYIFLEECFSEDKGRQEDIKIVEQIASLVGRENLIIKRHPRNIINRFGKLGYKTMKSNGIPWEVYALDTKQPRHILITHSSGAALNFRFFTQNQDYTILLYKYFEDEHFFDMSKDTKRWFSDYEKKFQDRVLAPSNLDELKNILGRCRDELKISN